MGNIISIVPNGKVTFSIRKGTQKLSTVEARISENFVLFKTLTAFLTNGMVQNLPSYIDLVDNNTKETKLVNRVIISSKNQKIHNNNYYAIYTATINYNDIKDPLRSTGFVTARLCGKSTGTDNIFAEASYNLINLTQGQNLLIEWAISFIPVEIPTDEIPNNPVENITISGANEVIVGQSITLTATLPAGATGKTITWISSNSNIAIVNENGIVTGVAEGSVTITAAAGGITSEAYTIIVNEATTSDNPEPINPSEEPIESKTYNLSYLTDFTKNNNITLNSGDTIIVDGIEGDYNVSVYAYCKDKIEDFVVVAKDNTSTVCSWLDYQEKSVYPYTEETTEKDFLKYEKSKLTLDKTAGSFSLVYKDFESILGNNIIPPLLVTNQGSTEKDREVIENLIVSNKFLAEITPISGNNSFKFYFNINDNWAELFNLEAVK